MEYQQTLEETFKRNLRDFQNQIGVWVFYPNPDDKIRGSIDGRRI